MTRRPLKQIYKLLQKKCFFCGNQDYALLDMHRIIPGKEGGKYTSNNSLCTCANCHRSIYAGGIVVDKKYCWTGNGFLVH